MSDQLHGLVQHYDCSTAGAERYFAADGLLRQSGLFMSLSHCLLETSAWKTSPGKAHVEIFPIAHV